MLDKLNAIEAKYSQIEAQLGASETYSDPELVARLNKEQSELQPLVEVFRTYRRTLDAKAQAEEMMSDPELKELAQEEYQRTLEELPRLEREGRAVSATAVRELIKAGRWQEIRPLVPEGTWRYFAREENRERVLRRM